MTKLALSARLIALSVALLAPQVVATEAMAAKAKFERTKPHFNIGTIGNSAAPPDQITIGGNDGQLIVGLPLDCEENQALADGPSRDECALDDGR